MAITRQYQIHTEPVSTSQETVTEDRWHQPWSTPRWDTVRATAIALIASGVVLVEAPPFTETVTEDRWHQALSEPVRVKQGLPAGQQQFLAYTEAAPFSETVTEDRFHQPWSEPVRVKLGLGAHQQQTLAFVEAAPFTEAVTEDRWHQPWSTPVWMRRFDAAQQQASAFVQVIAPPFQISGFELDWVLPVQFTAKWTTSSTTYNFIAADQVTEDRWHQPWSEPVRAKPGLSSGLQQSLAFVSVVAAAPPTTSEDQWHQPWSEPIRLRGLAAADQQALAYTGAAPFTETVTEDRWHEAWSEPVRVKPGLPSGLQQASAFVALVPFAGEDSWHQRWSEPGWKRVLPTALYPTTTYGEAAPFTETVTESRWHQPWSEPVRVRWFNTALQQSLAFVSVVIPPPPPPIQAGINIMLQIENTSIMRRVTTVGY